MSRLKNIIDAMNQTIGLEPPIKEEKTKLAKVRNVPFDQMTYEELYSYEPPRNKLKEYVMQYIEVNGIKIMIFYAPLFVSGASFIDSSITGKILSLCFLPITTAWAAVGTGILIPYTIFAGPYEMLLPNCKKCGQQKTRHLAGWDGGCIVCGNPLCEDRTEMMTIRGICTDNKLEKNQEWVNAYDKKKKEHFEKIRKEWETRRTDDLLFPRFGSEWPSGWPTSGNSQRTYF